MFAYLVMTVGYFLLGSLAAPWMQALRQRSATSGWCSRS